MKKKYTVYRSKSIYGFSNPCRFYYVFINDADTEYRKSLLHPIECVGGIRYIGTSCCNAEPPSAKIMSDLEYCGEVDSIDDIDFNL